MGLMEYFYDKLKNIKSVKLYMPKPEAPNFVPLISFNIKGKVSDEVGKLLDKNGIEVRTGLHCAPSAHEFAGTLETGVIRVSPSIFNTKAEIDKLLKTLEVFV